jgi:hypothetical protein
MTPAWLHDDLSRPVDAPIRNSPHDRHPWKLFDVVSQFHVATAERYRARDLTGDGVKETLCNFYVCDVTRALGCPIPQQRANEIDFWLERYGEAHGWWRVGEGLAATLSGIGAPVVASWRNPKRESPGHVAVLVPPPRNAQGLWICQAGKENLEFELLAKGFGALQPKLWGHA